MCGSFKKHADHKKVFFPPFCTYAMWPHLSPNQILSVTDYCVYTFVNNAQVIRRWAVTKTLFFVIDPALVLHAQKWPVLTFFFLPLTRFLHNIAREIIQLVTRPTLGKAKRYPECKLMLWTWIVWLVQHFRTKVWLVVNNGNFECIYLRLIFF